MYDVSDLQSYQEKKLITKLVGNITEYSDRKTALAIQARSAPKDAFIALANLSYQISPHKLIVFIDDLYSQVFLRRSRKEQIQINNQYEKFFKKLNCVTKFSSNLYEIHFKGKILKEILKIAEKITLREFIGCLPLQKRLQLENLTLDEILHALMELLLFEVILESRINTLIIGQMSEAILALHRNIESGNRLSAIVTPKFNS